MTLGEKQRAFAYAVGELLGEIYARGLEVTLGEAWRPPETAEVYAKTGRGIKNSLHCNRLAVDLNLFKEGAYQTGSEAWQEIGEWWEERFKEYEAVWGGRFKDANHFSFGHEGRK